QETGKLTLPSCSCAIPIGGKRNTRTISNTNVLTEFIVASFCYSARRLTFLFSILRLLRTDRLFGFHNHFIPCSASVDFSHWVPYKQTNNSYNKRRYGSHSRFEKGRGADRKA